MNPIEPFLEHAESFPDQPALIFAEGAIGFGKLRDEADALAEAYKAAGVRPHDAVLVALPIGIDLYRTMLALWHCGAIAVLPDASASLAGLQSGLRQVPLKALVTNWKGRILGNFIPVVRKISLLLPRAAPLQTRAGKPFPLSDNDGMLITFTSGSTGRPKGILRTKAFLEKQLDSIRKLLELRAGEMDILSLPVFALANLVSGVTSVFPEGPLSKPSKIDAIKLAADIRKYRPSRLVVPPVIVENLLRETFSWPQSLHVFTGGGPVYPDLLKRMFSSIPADKITAVYGSTEAEPIAVLWADAISGADWQDMQCGQGILAGTVRREIRLAIRDDEILVTGEEVVRGYIDPSDDNETKTEIDGEIWHRTGDAGRLDEKGRLWLLGRRAAGGKGHYPFQIEAAARLTPAVEQAAFVMLQETPMLAYTGGPLTKNHEEKLRNLCPGLVLIHLDELPFDRRHNSKVDYVRLKGMLQKAQ